LFGLYPLIITALAVIVLGSEYWAGGLAYHSIFGIFFFVAYFVVLLTYLKSGMLFAVSSLISMKLLYVL
jgi:hypothetical protein